jgi:hypothetical protein
MITPSLFDVLLGPIDQVLADIDYVRRPPGVKGRETVDFDYLDAEWTNSKTGLRMFLSYGVDRRDGFRSFAVFLFDRKNRSIDLEAAARQLEPALGDVFRVGHPKQPEPEFVEQFSGGFANRVVPAVVDLLRGVRWPEVRNPWDDYR